MTSKTLAEVYEDRNRLAVAFASLLRQHRLGPLDYGEPPRQDYRGWWKPDEGDDADADEWAIVYGSLPTGQVSWHVPREMAERDELLRKHDRWEHAEWDGHSRAEKNDRLALFSRGDIGRD